MITDRTLLTSSSFGSFDRFTERRDRYQRAACWQRLARAARRVTRRDDAIAGRVVVLPGTHGPTARTAEDVPTRVDVPADRVA